MLKELVRQTRSIRRFHQDQEVSRETLLELVDVARLTASAANLQPLKYVLSHDPERNAAIFSCLAWAGYLRDWPGPAEGERPAAYLVILGDRQITTNFGCDHGIAAQTILLAARELGLGGCMLGSIQRERLRQLLALPDRYEILLVIALGVPKEEVVLEEVGPEGDIRYWRDSQGVHHVPKRRLADLVVDLPV
jgi:nitroreductase|uniref:Nitroreductase family protein n=1 Tax=Desulfobacca acetoxidans TaxID=60893 RepID=A0A7C5AK31_9BACT